MLFRRFYAIPKDNKLLFAKPILSASQAIASSISSGSSVFVGGFGLCGIPEKCLQTLSKNTQIKNLCLISNDAGIPDYGIGPILKNGQITKIMASYVGENPDINRLYKAGFLELHLIPQGTLAEAIRCGGAGIPIFYTKSGIGTAYESGGIPIRLGGDDGKETYRNKKETEEIDGIKYIKESAIRADVALIKAWKADDYGNIIFKETASNFNAIMAKSAKRTIVEVEELISVGSLDPNCIHLSGIYVDALVKSDITQKKILHRTIKNKCGEAYFLGPKNQIARRASRELAKGMYVNLGIGIPQHVNSFLNLNKEVVFIDSENGILGMGPYPDTNDKVDADLVNAGKETVTIIPGGSFFSSDESFSMIRGGHFNTSMLGAFQVSSNGDLANWIIPGKLIMGMGGAMDLAASNSKIIVLMTHLDKYGNPKIVQQCTFPLTAPHCVDRIITDMCVFDVEPLHGLTLVETNEGYSIEQIRKCTGCDFKISPQFKSTKF